MDYKAPSPLPGQSSAQALLHVAQEWLERDVHETWGSNRGQDVDWIITHAGASWAIDEDDKRKPGPAWCGLFVSACAKICTSAGRPVWRPRTAGRAVSWYQQAPPEWRVSPDDIFLQNPLGLVFVRTRLSRPRKDVTRAKMGERVTGHVGIVESIDPVARTVTCIAGNSSGFGHDVGGKGGVAREVYTENGPGWNKLVGFVRVTEV